MMDEVFLGVYKFLVILLPIALIILVVVVIKAYSSFMAEIRRLTGLYVDAWDAVKNSVKRVAAPSSTDRVSVSQPEEGGGVVRKTVSEKGLSFYDRLLLELNQIKFMFKRIKKKHEVRGLHHEIRKVEAKLETVKKKG